jgi:putative ABC transport system permease protein
MFKNHFKIAWRNIRKNRLYSLINIFGLTIGITCCILIGVYIFDELSYDRFNTRANRIVRVTAESGSGGTVSQFAQTGTKVGPQFSRSFPEIEAFVRLMKSQRVMAYGDKLFTEKNFLYADPSFFKIFSFSFVAGDMEQALSSTDKIVLTQSGAKKYFGNEGAVGKILKVNDKNFSVSAIVKDVPGNSQIQFDYIVAFNNLKAASTEQWGTANYITYLLLRNKQDIDKVQQKIAAYMKTDAVRNEYRAVWSDYLTYHLEPLLRVHLYSSMNGLEPNGSITYVYILGIIALLILSIACVNYTNLATAQAAGRSAEIGIRKVMGALKYQLFVQFIGESLLVISIAVIAAFLLSTQLFPVLNNITGKHLTPAVLLEAKPLLYIFIGTLIVGFAAGAYPALILSGAVIISILKTGFRFTSAGKGLRKSLIVFQFVISVFLIIATIVILQQLNFIRNKNLGYDKQRILEVPVDSRVRSDYYTIKNRVSLLPQVQSVTGAHSSPVLVEWGDGITTDNGHDKINLSINAIPVDLGFIKTFNMQIIAGTDYTTDDLKQLEAGNRNKHPEYAYILNETAAKKIGWSSQQAIGKKLSVGESRPGFVKAIVKDFNFQSMHESIGPLMLFLDTQFVRRMFVKISGNNVPGTIQQIEKIWKGHVPYRPYEYRFLDDEFKSLYDTEQRAAQLFSIFSSLAILLACLGLFGLAAFTTVQRTKEIGVRKVLGANVRNITVLISKDFLKLVMIAAVIAFPVAWLVMNKWIESFAYRIDISIWVFIGAALTALLIALITVSFQVVKAAMANPVKSLRAE